MTNDLAQIALGCADLDRAIEFYANQLGFELVAKFDPPGLAFFRIGGIRLLLERCEAPNPGSSVLYFSVSDLAGRYEALAEKQVRFDSGPHLIHTDKDGIFGEPGTEEWMAFFRDPDGNCLALVERRHKLLTGQGRG
jgi:methylmalonyl-CoA/ethylmalonyl-CoA epimerase